MITLTQAELQQIDRLLGEIPFKYAYPIFKILKDKVEQEGKKEQIKKQEEEKI